MLSDFENALTEAKETQLVYLDFDGAETSYNNSTLKINQALTVKDSGLSQQRMDNIQKRLNQQYADSGVIFVTDESLLTSESFSTVFVGNSDLFSDEFYGLAESIDVGNQNRQDNAFVFLDQSYTDNQIISVINHELGHIIGGESHSEENNSLQDFAMDKLISSKNLKYSVTVEREGGYYPGYARVTPKRCEVTLPSNADKAVITVTNNGISSAFGYDRCYTDIYVTLKGVKYSINSGKSKSFTVKSNSLLSFSRDAYLPLEVAFWDPVYKRYKYYSGWVKNQISVSVSYYSDVPAADLSIFSAKLSKTAKYSLRFAPNESFKYTFVVENKGDLWANNTLAYIYVDGKKFASVAVGSIAAGKKKTYTYTFRAGALKSGSHTISVKADGANAVKEFSESNNSSGKRSLTVGKALADLAITNLNISDAAGESIMVSDRKIKVSTVITNRSCNKNSSKVTAKFYANNKLLKTFTISAIGAEKSRKISFEVAANKLTAGEKNFKLVIDTNKSCTEYDESNNSISVKKDVYAPIKPDLKINKISITNSSGGSTIYNNKSVKVSVAVGNYIYGNQARLRSSKATTLKLMYGNTVLKTLQIPALAPQKNYNVDVLVPAGIITTASSKKITAVIDPENRCSESNEKNNSSTITLAQKNPLIVSNPTIHVYESQNKASGSFTITNNSNVWSKNFLATVNDRNGNYVCDIAVDALAPGASKIYSFTKNVTKLYDGVTLNCNDIENKFNITRDFADSSYIQGVYYAETIIKPDRIDFNYCSGGSHIDLYLNGNLIDTVTDFDNSSCDWSGYSLSYNDNFGVVLYNPDKTEHVYHDNYYFADYYKYEQNENSYNYKSLVTDDFTINHAAVSWNNKFSGVQQLTFSVTRTGRYDFCDAETAVLLENGKEIAVVNLPYIALNSSETITCTIDADKALSVGNHDLTLQITDGSVEDSFDFSANISEQPAIVNKNPENIAPKVTASTTIYSNGTGLVSAKFSDASGIKSKFYSIDSGSWQNYTQAVKVDKNCTVHFKAIDKTGNTAVYTHKVNNLVKISDIAIKDYKLAKTKIHNKEALKITFKIMNNGNVTAKPSKLYIYDGNKKIGSIDVNYIEARASKSYSYTIAAGKLAVGKHTISMIADATGVINEINGTNNKAAKTVSVEKIRYGLTVKNVTASKNTINNKQSVKLSFNLVNDGNISAKATKIYIYDKNNKTLGCINAAAIAAGKSKSYTYTIAAGKLPLGSNKLKIKVDASNLIKESNEKNNIAYKTIKVEKPRTDLALTNFKTNAQSVYHDSTVKFSFTIKNTGNTDVKSTKLNFYCGSKVIGSINVASIAAGKSRNYTYTLAASKLPLGNNKIQIKADASGILTEKNESNNSVFKTIKVLGADLTLSNVATKTPTVFADETVQVSFSVKNCGNAAAKTTTLNLYSNNKVIGSVNIAALEAGMSRDYVYKLSADQLSAGNNKIQIKADASGILTEKNESNNCAYVNINVEQLPVDFSNQTLEAMAYEDFDSAGFNNQLLRNETDLTAWQQPDTKQLDEFETLLGSGDGQFADITDLNYNNSPDLLSQGCVTTLNPETDEYNKLLENAKLV